MVMTRSCDNQDQIYIEDNPYFGTMFFVLADFVPQRLRSLLHLSGGGGAGR